MCGICGIYGFEDKELLKRMCDVIEHRGPDDSGIFLDKIVGLGNRRLSIIDVVGGRQPIHNENESIWITYNGEVYNFKEIREELQRKGHKFYTNTDTETIVHSYEEYGEECLKKLRGMFAFAIWDSNKKMLFLARDRLGKKPLYYYYKNGIFIFGSEIKSILQYNMPRLVDYDAVHSYLTYRFVFGSSTIFRDIKRLPSGCSLICTSDGISIKKYWDIAMSPQVLSEDYCVKKLGELLRESIRLRLMSDVPLGAYLSGGIDSSTVVAMMSTLLDEPVKTFSVGFGDPEFDETDYARTVADYFETDHHEFIVEPNAMKLFPKIIWHFEEPIADPALFPTYMLSECAKKYVTVVLTGEGGDELFAGYEHYKIMTLAEKYHRNVPDFVKIKVAPAVLKKVPKKILDKLFRYSSLLGDEGINRVTKYISILENKGESYLSIISIFDDDEKQQLYAGMKEYANTNLAIELNEKYFSGMNSNGLLNRLLYLEIKTSLPEHLLMKVDKMTMAHSIEARAPFLDHLLAEFSAALPQNLKLNGFVDKYILRKTMNQLLPKKITKRQKQRFFVPIDKWLNGGEARELTLQILDSDSIKKRGYFNYEYIRRMFEKFDKSKLYYSRQIWSLVALELWHRIYVEQDELYKPNLSIDNLLYS